MKQNNIIALLSLIMLFSLAAAFITSDAFLGKLLSSLGIISGALCSGQFIKQNQS